MDQDDNITDFIPGKLLQYHEKEQYKKMILDESFLILVMKKMFRYYQKVF